MSENQTALLKVLHLEDSPRAAELIHSALREGGLECSIRLVKTRDNFTDALERSSFDIILSDYSLPTYAGTEALEIARRTAPDTPFIFVSGTPGEDAAIQSLVGGATDYVLKARLGRLVPAVRRAIRESDERKRRRIAEELKEKALAELKKSEARFRGVLECAPDAAIIIESTGKITFANDQAGRIFGIGSKDLIGKSIEEFIPERFREVHRKHVTGYISMPHARGMGTELELYGRRADGTEFPADIMLSPLKMDHEMLVLAMIRDTTSSREAEKALRESEARFRLIYEASPVGIMIVDEQGKIIRCNPAVLDLVGYTEEELRQKTYNDITHPEDRHVGPEMSRELMAGETDVVTYEKRYIRKDGQLVWVHVTHSAVRDEIGNYRFGLGIIEDFTERKKAEEALRSSEDRYRNLVDSARDAIFGLSTSTIIESLNPAFETLTGWKREEWIGRSVTDLVHPDDRSTALEKFREALDGSNLEPVRLRIVKKSGDYAVGEFNSTQLVHNGKLVGILGIARDVTLQIAMEEQLRQSQKMESIGTLAGGIAHDFNNILAIIMSYSNLSRRFLEPGDKLSGHLAAIESAAQRGIGLVRQLLMFARKQDRTLEYVDVNSVVADVFKMVSATFPKIIATQLNRIKGELVIYGDPTEIHQAVLNLCINARDAMMERDDGLMAGGKLTISTSLAGAEEIAAEHPSAAGESYARIEVSDTGKGMDQSTQERIFEPFYTTKEKGKGTGLGLSTVYGIVSAQEGFLEVSSRLREGTTFTILLPARNPSPNIPEASSPAPVRAIRGSGTVLVVEDEEGLRELLHTILTDSGYNVLTAEDGKRALAIFFDHKEIDLVISDLGLPKVGGLDLFEAIRRMKPGMKVILVSGFISDSDRQRMQDERVNGFVQKPYRPQEVLEQVRRVFEDRSG